jgi:hypothetical protein
LKIADRKRQIEGHPTRSWPTDYKEGHHAPHPYCPAHRRVAHDGLSIGSADASADRDRLAADRHTDGHGDFNANAPANGYADATANLSARAD